MTQILVPGSNSRGTGGQDGKGSACYIWTRPDAIRSQDRGLSNLNLLQNQWPRLSVKIHPETDEYVRDGHFGEFGRFEYVRVDL